MRRVMLVVAAMLSCTVSPVRADEAVTNPPPRFSFQRVDDGFLRLDNNGGQVAFCSPHSIGWACQAVPEDRAALEKEIARLHEEVARLKQEVVSLRPPEPPRPPVDVPTPEARRKEDAARLHDDLARARLAFENAWRRLVEMIANLQTDLMPKS